jgi:hypothetical protein
LSSNKRRTKVKTVPATLPVPYIPDLKDGVLRRV